MTKQLSESLWIGSFDGGPPSMFATEAEALDYEQNGFGAVNTTVDQAFETFMSELSAGLDPSLAE